MLKRIVRIFLVPVLGGALLLGGSGCALLKKKAETTETAAPSPTPTPKPPVEKKSLVDVLTFGLLNKSRKKKKDEPPRAQAAIQVGVVKLVNEDDKFVLIDTVVFQAGAAGDTLVTIADGKETSTLKVSTLRNPPFLIADIVDGSPGRGDRVYKPGQNVKPGAQAGTH